MYLNKLQKVSHILIASWDDYLKLSKAVMIFLRKWVVRISDHGLEQIYAVDYNETEIKNIFRKLTAGETMAGIEHMKFKSAMLVKFAEWDHEKNWVQQYHLGAIEK